VAVIEAVAKAIGSIVAVAGAVAEAVGAGGEVGVEDTLVAAGLEVVTGGSQDANEKIIMLAMSNHPRSDDRSLGFSFLIPK
jgi:hypothetical protein